MQRFDDTGQKVGKRTQKAEDPWSGAHAFNLSRHSVPGVCRYRPRQHRRAGFSSRICNSLREAYDDRTKGEFVSQSRLATNLVRTLLSSFLQASPSIALTQAHFQLRFANAVQLTINLCLERFTCFKLIFFIMFSRLEIKRMLIKIVTLEVH